MDPKQAAPRSAAPPATQIVRTEPNPTERELVEQRERLRIALASVGEGVVSTDVGGRITFLNGVAEILTGWPQAEALGQPLSEVFHGIDAVSRKPLRASAQRALEQGETVPTATTSLLVARDGTERPIDQSAAPMHDEAGALIGSVLVFRDVSERQRAARAQAQLAAIVQSSEDAILSKTLDGIIQSWNGGAERLFAYSADEAIGQSVTILIPPERADEESAILERLRRGERVEHFETVRLAKDGRRLDISLTISPIKDSHGVIIGASKIARDITARKRADEALRSSEARHRLLADLAQATQPLTDPNAIMATTARMLAERLGADRCAYAEVDDDTLVITGDYSRAAPSIMGRWPIADFGPELARCMRANEPFVIEDVARDARAGAGHDAYARQGTAALICVPLHKGGELVAAMTVHHATARRWRRADVELVRMVAARSWDTLERGRAARVLEQAAQRLALAFDAARLGDWSWDIASDLVTLSPRAADIFGVAPSDALTGAQLQALINPADRDNGRLAVDRAVAGGGQYDVEYRVRRAGGPEVWVSSKGRAQYHDNGLPRGMYGVVQDISERKRLEQELRRRASELAEADRKKDDFIALLAHELRNPLAPIRTGLQVMRLAAGDPGMVANARDMMDRQLGHMVRLIDDLLDISRLSRGKLHLQKGRVTLAEIVSHAVEATEGAIDAAGHLLHVALPREPVLLDADLTRLAQVFGNLLSNSTKYTARGGQIWLTAEIEGAEVVVAVRDNGLGIPADALGHIFDMFSQVDRSVERVTGGLGIGLALVRGLVEAHGGKVSAASRGAGTGTTFTVRLPIASSRPLRAVPPANETVVRTSRRVLIADDNPDGAEALAALLELLGNQVVVAHDGREAVELAEREQPDLILMDVGMPHLNGLDATREIRRQPWGKPIQIMALTGWGQANDRERSRVAGCDGHLVKPVGLQELEKLLAGLPERPPT